MNASWTKAYISSTQFRSAAEGFKNGFSEISYHCISVYTQYLVSAIFEGVHLKSV